jgi:hypothetical protein
MGFFDYRCSLTGVSLKASDAVFLPLHNINGEYKPLTLGIKGCYDRLGTIDGIKKDKNTDSILKFFQQAHDTGALAFNKLTLKGLDCYPIKDIEDLLRCFERHIADAPKPAELDGVPIQYALIEKQTWEFLVERSTLAEKGPETMWESLFPGASVARQIYKKKESEVLPQLRELYRVSLEMKAHGIEWEPVDELGQHFSEEMTEFLKEAKTRFKDAPLFLGALAAYEDEVSEFLADEEDE